MARRCLYHAGMGCSGGNPIAEATWRMIGGLVFAALASRSTGTRFQFRNTNAWKVSGKCGRSTGTGVGPVGIADCAAPFAKISAAMNAKKHLIQVARTAKLGLIQFTMEDVQDRAG